MTSRFYRQRVNRIKNSIRIFEFGHIVVHGIIALVLGFFIHLLFGPSTVETFQEHLDVYSTVVHVILVSSIYFIILVIRFKYKEDIRLREALVKQEYFEILGNVFDMENSEFFQYKSFFMSNVFSWIESAAGGGGIVLNKIGNSEYINLLRRVFEKSDKSFEATLTGRYTPHWFFFDDVDKITNKTTLYSDDKLNYLRIINEHSKGKRSVRIMIFSKTQLENAFNNLSDENINTFFNLNSNVKLYWIEPDTLDGLITSNDMRKSFNKDYGIFNKYMILKRDRSDQIEILSSTNNPEYTVIFDQLRNDVQARGRFKKFKTKEEIINTFNLKIQTTGNFWQKRRNK